MSFSFPKVYPILDAGVIPQVGRAEFLRRLASELAEAGVTLLEYRNKTGSDAELLADAAILRAALPAGTVKLILDDRVELVERAGFDGVHVDAGDATPAEARRLLGPDRIVGTFGGSEALRAGDSERAGGLFFDRADFSDDNQSRRRRRRSARRECAGCASRRDRMRCSLPWAE